MDSKIKLLLLFILITFVGKDAAAQNKETPFWEEIQSFKQKDKEAFPPEDGILFIGSSSFTMWKDIDEYFPDQDVINRGFGGSTLKDIIGYADDIIFPYKPKQIIIYAGDNDAVESENVSASDIFNRFKTLYTIIRTEFPEVEIAYVSIKPSPSREKFFRVMEKANWEIRTFLEKEKDSDFIDIWHLMLDDFGEARKELFKDDMLHMNQKGYEIWAEAITPYIRHK